MPLLGEFSALATAALWSGSSLVFAAAAARVGSVGVNIGRLILALVLLLGAIVVFRLPTALSGSQIVALAVSGVIGLALGDSFLFKAFQEIGARVSMLIMSGAPAISAAAAYLMLGEVLSVWGIAGMIVTVAGIAIVIMERGGGSAAPVSVRPRGVLYAFFGAAGQGVGLVFAKMAFNEGEVDGFVATTIRICASLVVLLPVLGMTGRLTRPFDSLRKDRIAVAQTAAGSVMGPFLGITLSLVAVANTSVGVAATIMATVPILMLPLVRFVHRERLSPRAVTGAFVAVGGVAILFLR